MKRKIAAIMAADVFGYSRLIAEDEEGTLRRLLACREVFADFVGRAGGRVFNTAGDAVLAEFPSAVEGLRAAVEIQESLRTRNRAYPESRQLLFRIGMTIGDVVEREGDLLGDGVNIAARLESLAEPGGICLSRSVHEQVSSKMALPFRDIGPQTVKNIPGPIHAYRVAGAPAAEPAPPVAAWARPRTAALAACVALLGLGAAAVMHLRPGGVVVAAPPSSPNRPAPAAAAPATTPEAAAPVAATRAAAERADLPAGAKPTDAVALPPPAPSGDATPSASPRPVKAAEIPFVTDQARLEIARTLRSGSNSAVAIGPDGTSGYVSRRSTPERARHDAMEECGKAGGGDCALYAVNDAVVWPRALPRLPPRPWVDPDAPRTPFDASRLVGLSAADRATIASGYRASKTHKALALGADGVWRYFFDVASVAEAERLALELCGDEAGAACRIVAVDGDFVVPLPATAPAAAASLTASRP